GDAGWRGRRRRSDLPQEPDRRGPIRPRGPDARHEARVPRGGQRGARTGPGPGHPGGARCDRHPGGRRRRHPDAGGRPPRDPGGRGHRRDGHDRRGGPRRTGLTPDHRSGEGGLMHVFRAKTAGQSHAETTRIARRLFGGVPYPDRIHRVAVLGYGAMLWTREVILSATSNSKHLRSLPAASLQPLLGLVGLALFVPLPPGEIVLALVVFASFFASAVAYTEIAKRPLLRSFGVDGLKLLRSTLDHYTEPEASGIAELETFFDSMSVRARVRVGGLAFRVGTRLKALFIAPTVHPGPMGYVSGSDLPTKIARDLSDLTSNVMVAHGPTTHDENPATTAEVRK